MTSAERIVTIIANPANPCLTPELADSIRTALEASALYFLADGIACDIPLPSSCTAPDKILATALDGQKLDWVVQEADNRRKKVLLADMDSTLIRQECIDELADELGIGERVCDITARAMRGELDFEPALRERVALFAGQPRSVIQKVLNTRITLMPGGAELVATMKSTGGYCALVSGGFTEFTSVIAQKLGFDEHRANTFEFSDDRFTGRVVPPILGREAKVEALRDIVQQQGLSSHDVIAVGDGANDLGMLKLAGSGVALHAKPVVAEQAGIRIDHADLTALLYIQGYRKADFAP